MVVRGRVDDDDDNGPRVSFPPKALFNVFRFYMGIQHSLFCVIPPPTLGFLSIAFLLFYGFSATKYVALQWRLVDRGLRE